MVLDYERRLSAAIAVALMTLCGVEITRGEDPVMANREALARDLTNLALRAQDFYYRPTAKGGGHGSFGLLTADAAGLSRLTSKATNSNGTYYINTAGTSISVEISGLGTMKGTDGNPLNFDIQVFADSTYMTFNN